MPATFSRLPFSLSAPFVIASLLYNLTLGAINRAMPQLMVTLVGAPRDRLWRLVPVPAARADPSDDLARRVP
ncbi:flagellar biosynthetic protein FliR [Jhaorihella thermophila]